MNQEKQASRRTRAVAMVNQARRLRDFGRSAMKYLTSSLCICIALLSCAAVAHDTTRIPPFSRLDAVAGAHADSVDFKRLLQDYQFSPNPKRDNSWGSGFGVFLERSKTGLISIGIRPPSSATNMPTYHGNLPKGLKPEDTIESLKRKLGQPDRMLTELKEKSEPTDATKDRASRFGNGKSTAATRLSLTFCFGWSAA